MRISALTLEGQEGWPAFRWSPITPGLNALFGPAGSGKSTVADFLGHVLFGRLPPPAGLTGAGAIPDGEAIVESGESHYRLRRTRRDGAATRLTVSSLDGAKADHDTVRRMLGGMSPGLLGRLGTIRFDQPPRIDWLLSADFAREFQASGVALPAEGSRRVAELLARRDTLAKEMETRLAGERRASRELVARRRELDRLIADAERQLAALHDRLRGVEAALTETDTRLRYRRLELNVDHAWWTSEPANSQDQLDELDAQIARWQNVLAELASREATLRSRLAQIRTANGVVNSTLTDERAWLAVARQLTADLSGEVARLARASASDACVCRDAHPRLRPIVETFERQLDMLAALVSERQQELTANALEGETALLARSQAELTRQLEFLIQQRHAVAHGTLPSRRTVDRSAIAPADRSDAIDSLAGASITAADAEQLEARRIELEQERFDTVQQIDLQNRQLRDLRAQRTTVDRQRAALLSARSIEHIQRELNAVQQKLEQLAIEGTSGDGSIGAAGTAPRASSLLAKFTNGRLVRLQLVDHGRRANVATREGTVLAIDALPPADRDLVYLSLSIALLTAAVARHGVSLPLILDEPFLRLDAPEVAAMAAVLDDLARHGQQILIFTGRREAADRLASLGSVVHDVHSLHRRDGELTSAAAAAAFPASPAARPVPTSIRPITKKAKSTGRKSANGKRRPPRPDVTPTDAPNPADRSDAA